MLMLPLKMNSINALVRVLAIVLFAGGLAACSGPEVINRADLDFGGVSVSNDDIQAFALNPAKAYSDNQRLIASRGLSSHDALVRLHLIRRALDWDTVDDYRARFYYQAGDLYLRCNVRHAKAGAYAAYFMAGVLDDHLALEINKALDDLSERMSKRDALMATSYVAMHLQLEASRSARQARKSEASDMERPKEWDRKSSDGPENPDTPILTKPPRQP